MTLLILIFFGVQLYIKISIFSEVWEICYIYHPALAAGLQFWQRVHMARSQRLNKRLSRQVAIQVARQLTCMMMHVKVIAIRTRDLATIFAGGLMAIWQKNRKFAKFTENRYFNT